MPTGPETGLELPLAMFHIDNESANGDESHEKTALGVPVNDTPADQVTTIDHNFSIPARVIDGLRQTSAHDDHLFNSPVPVTVLSAPQCRQGSSPSVDREPCASDRPRKRLAEKIKSRRDARQDQIPEIIILSARPRGGSLAGQFWKRKASRSHRVDEVAFCDNANLGRTARPTFSPYTRERRRDKGGRGSAVKGSAFNTMPPSLHTPILGLELLSGYSDSLGLFGGYETLPFEMSWVPGTDVDVSYIR